MDRNTVQKVSLFKSIWYIILHLNGQLTVRRTGVIKTHDAELKVLILFCSLRSWLCTDVDAHQPQPLQNWGLIHELPFWSETNHEDIVTYFKTRTFAGELSWTIIFVSICQLTYCLPAVFLSSRTVSCNFCCVIFEMKLLGQHSDLLFKQICYL